MILYNVVDDVIVGIRYRHLPKTDTLCTLEVPPGSSLFNDCRKVSSLEEDITSYGLFISLPLAIVHVVGKYKKWNILIDESVFDDWVKEHVR